MIPTPSKYNAADSLESFATSRACTYVITGVDDMCKKSGHSAVINVKLDYHNFEPQNQHIAKID